MMGNGKELWFEALEDFEDWWLHVTEYANWEGDYELPVDFYKRNNKVCNFVEEVAQRDVTPFHEIGGLVKRHAGIVCSDPDYPRNSDPHARVSEIHNAIYRALPAKQAYMNQLLIGCKSGTAPPTFEDIASQLDGPYGNCQWRHNGEVTSKRMQPAAWHMCKYLWEKHDRVGDFDELKGPVYNDPEHFADADAYGSLRKGANKFFRVAEIPLCVRISKTLVSLTSAE